MKLNKINALKALAIFQAIIILIMFLFIVWYCFIRNEGLAVRTGKHVERTAPVIEKEETFYQYDGKKIFLHDSTLGETFLPAYSDVPESPLNPDNFVKSSAGFITYNGSETDTVITGIDVSEHQGIIDWEQVKASGIDFAMIRIGYRTYGDGIITIDSNYSLNIEGATAAGLDVGVYFFSQAINTHEATEEADAVLDAILGYNITYPVVFDWEMIFDDHARTDEVGVETLADCCVTFCERVKSAGYTPMIYQNSSTAIHKLDLPRVKDYEFWLAEYTDKPSYYYNYDMWQYTSKGEVAGVSGLCDVNICFKDYSAIPEPTSED